MNETVIPKQTMILNGTESTGGRYGYRYGYHYGYASYYGSKDK